MNYKTDTFYLETAGVAQYLCLVADNSGDKYVKVPTQAQDPYFVGVAAETLTAAGNISVATEGIYPITIASEITRGSWVEIAGTSGKIQTATNSTPAATFVVGIAMESGTSDGDEILVLLRPGYILI